MSAVRGKVRSTFRLVLILLAFLSSFHIAIAQRPSSTPLPPVKPIDGQDRTEERPLTTFEEEIRAKREIKLAEKDHEENLDRAREISQIGKELQNNLKGKSAIDRDSLKKIERLEKLTKKVRGEAGGDDEEVEIVDRPTDIASAAIQIAEASEALSKAVINTPRQVVSASMIGNANVLLELIKLLRSFDRRP
jgi:hypothetical protein